VTARGSGAPSRRGLFANAAGLALSALPERDRAQTAAVLQGLGLA